MKKNKLKTIAIFDFNRTIYDPDHRTLTPWVRMILHALRGKDYDLYLISTANPSRKELIKKLGLDLYFTKILITKSKKWEFQKIGKSKMIDFSKSFVVGDRVKSEITYGNELGMITIWIKNGRFANEKPSQRIEQPSFIVPILRDILTIIT